MSPNRLSARVPRFVWLFAAFTTIAAIPSTGEANVLTTDVCVIGGGSAGIYTAVALRALGKSVIVLEKSGRIGGHAETYKDPATGTPINLGVLYFQNTDVVKSYASLLNVSLTTINPSASPVMPTYVDFRTGFIDPTFAVNATAQAEAIAAYAAQIAKYPYLVSGFNLPDPVPKDLLLSTGQFFEKYNLEPALYLFWTYLQGFGDVLNVPVIYAIKTFSLVIVQSLQLGFLAPVSGDAQEFYDKALAYLGDSVLLNSNVFRVTRSATSVEVVVKTPSGKKIIRAQKLIVAIPPTLSNLKPFDLSSEESFLFGQFTGFGYYTGVLNNTGLPDGASFSNVGTDAPFNIPPEPAIYGLSSTLVPGLFGVKYGSVQILPDDEVKCDIVNAVERLHNAGFNTQAPNFPAFSSHSPFELHVTAEAIRRGFYGRLNALQGQQSTFFTGAAWDAVNSGSIWAFTQTLLPQIVATLG